MEVSGSYFKDLIAFHLRSKYQTGLEVVAVDPEKFHKAITDLIGEYSAKVLENLILQILTMGPSPIKINELRFPQIIERIRKRELKVSEELLHR